MIFLLASLLLKHKFIFVLFVTQQHFLFSSDIKQNQRGWGTKHQKMPGINSEKSDVCLEWGVAQEAGPSQEMKD